MSILRKIPKIEQVLDNMSLESLKRLESLMNSGNGATETYTLFGGENKLNYTNKDLGVWYCNIELERNKSVETGFLIWESETKALFVSFDITQCLKEYEIDLTNYTFVLINEKLSIEEFRRVLEDNINKEVVHIDTSGNVEIGKNLVVDGKIIVNDASKIVDTSGNELISDGGLTFPTTSPSSQVIPSITTSNTQQNLTIGDGLAIENGALKTKEKIKIFQPTITNVSSNTDDTKKQIYFNFTINYNNFSYYENNLFTNGKLYDISFICKSEEMSGAQLTFSGSLSSDASTASGAPLHLLRISDGYGGAIDMRIGFTDIRWSIEFDFSQEIVYNQFTSLTALFTTNTLLKAIIKEYE